jgi:hypothetical protein
VKERASESSCVEEEKSTSRVELPKLVTGASIMEVSPGTVSRFAGVRGSVAEGGLPWGSMFSLDACDSFDFEGCRGTLHFENWMSPCQSSFLSGGVGVVSQDPAFSYPTARASHHPFLSCLFNLSPFVLS